MQGALALLILIVSVNISWCQTKESDSSRLISPKIIHISTSAHGPLDSLAFSRVEAGVFPGELMVLSLVSIDQYDNWDENEWRQRYKGQNVLIVMAREDSEQKSKFVLSFYQNLLSTDSKLRAYEQALREVTVEFKDLHLRHVLILNE